MEPDMTAAASLSDGERKRILLLIPNLDFGGAQRAFSKLSLELAQKHDIYVAVFNTYEGIAFPYGGQLVDLEIPGSAHLLGKAVQFLKRIWKIRQLKRSKDIDVSLSFLEGADYVNLLSKGRERTCISIRGSKVHDGEIRGALGWIRKKVLLPWSYRIADDIITVSEGLKAELVNFYGQNAAKISTIYNYYEAEAIQELKEAPLAPEFEPLFRHPVLITSGRLHFGKTLGPMLEVFARMPERQTHKLVILGDGELRASLLQKCAELGLKAYARWEDRPLTDTNQVYFLGYQENPFQFIGRSKLFVFTSSWEGFPNVLAESMICGVPVVSTDCPTGPREILAPDTPACYNLEVAEHTPYGYLMPLLNKPNNEAAVSVWANTLHILLSDQAAMDRLISQARERSTEFSKEKIFRKWEQVLTQPQKNLLLMIPNLDFGGAQRAFHYMSVELAKQFNVTECVFNTFDGLAYPTGNQLVDLKIPGGKTIFSKFYYFLLRCYRVHQLKKDLRIDVSISQLEGADYVNILSRLRPQEKQMLCIQGSKSHDGEIRGFLGTIRKKFMLPLLYRKADRIVTVSRDIKTELVEDFNLSPGNIDVIHNPCDIDTVLVAQQEPVDPVMQRVYDENLVLVTSGRFHEQKNQLPLLEIFARLRQELPCRLVILGDGGTRSLLEAKALELGLRTYKAWEQQPLTPDQELYFMGFQSNPFKYLSKADWFVFPSSWEGFPLALIEAMACGQPIISTDCPTGPRELLAPETGQIKNLKHEEQATYGILMPMLPPDCKGPEIELWVQTLKRVLPDRQLREQYHQKSLQRMQDFSTQRIFNQWADLIRSIS